MARDSGEATSLALEQENGDGDQLDALARLGLGRSASPVNHAGLRECPIPVVAESNHRAGGPIDWLAAVVAQRRRFLAHAGTLALSSEVRPVTQSTQVRPPASSTRDAIHEVAPHSLHGIGAVAARASACARSAAAARR
jgi:hypothetical protein